jgi:orotidine 5'-phosphate decarboxylase subfamily 1
MSFFRTPTDSVTISQPAAPSVSTKSFEAREELCESELGKRIYRLMNSKKCNLAVAADVTKKAELLALARNLGPYICVFKTHIDVIEDFDLDLIEQLKAIAYEHNFILFEDRKFADIGNTVELQYGRGTFRIADWAPLSNAHSVPGDGIIESMEKIGLPKGNGILMLAQMSTKGNLATGQYTTDTIAMANKHRKFVTGFISREVLADTYEGFLNFTPGIKIGAKDDGKDQVYISPEKAVAGGSDVLIVGRGIYENKSAEQQIESAMLYQDICWKAYLARVAPSVEVQHTSTLSARVV